MVSRSNSKKNLECSILKYANRNQRNFAHVQTITLSWRVHNFVVIRVYFKPEHDEFLSNFEFDWSIICGMGAWSLIMPYTMIKELEKKPQENCHSFMTTNKWCIKQSTYFSIEFTQHKIIFTTKLHSPCVAMTYNCLAHIPSTSPLGSYLYLRLGRMCRDNCSTWLFLIHSTVGFQVQVILTLSFILPLVFPRAARAAEAFFARLPHDFAVDMVGTGEILAC